MSAPPIVLQLDVVERTALESVLSERDELEKRLGQVVRQILVRRGADPEKKALGLVDRALGVVQLIDRPVVGPRLSEDPEPEPEPEPAGAPPSRLPPEDRNGQG